jgi:hypothetical protein
MVVTETIAIRSAQDHEHVVLRAVSDAPAARSERVA